MKMWRDFNPICTPNKVTSTKGGLYEDYRCAPVTRFAVPAFTVQLNHADRRASLAADGQGVGRTTATLLPMNR